MALFTDLRAATNAVAQAECALSNWQVPADASVEDRAIAARLMAPTVARLEAARVNLAALQAQAAAVAQKAAALDACTRCNGQGRINAFRSIDNGRCFGCGGTGNWQRKAA